jgi:hypothetical protein
LTFSKYNIDKTGLVDNFEYGNFENLKLKNVLKVENLAPHFQHIVTGRVMEGDECPQQV